MGRGSFDRYLSYAGATLGRRFDAGAQVLNVMNPAFAGGARGDGLTDDTAALQAALDAAAKAEVGPATTGGVVYLPPQSTYKVVGPLRLPSNATLQGAGRSSVIKMAAGTNTRLLKNANASDTNIRIRDLTLDGNRANVTPDQAGAGTSTIWMESVTGLWIEDCWLLDSALVGIQTNNCSDVFLLRNWIDHPIKFGIFVGTDSGTSTNVQLVGNTVKRSGRHGIVVDGGYGSQGSVSHVLVADNYIETSSASPDWETLSGVTGGGIGIDVEEGVEAVRILGNTCTDNANWQISVIAGQHDWPVLYATVADNTVSGGTLEGFRIDQARSLTLGGNTSNGNGREGYYLSSCSGVTMRGNVAAFNGLSGWRVTDCAHVAAEGNVARSNGRNGLTIGAVIGDTSLRMASLSGKSWTAGDSLTIAGESGLTISGTPAVQLDGTYIVGLSAGLVANHAVGITVTNSTRSNSALLHFKPSYMGFYLESTGAATLADLTLNGNACFDDDASQTQAYGFYCFSNGGDAARVRIRGNDVRNNASAGISWTSSADVLAWDNQGFATEAVSAGTETISNPATSVVVTHGLDRTPHASEINIAPTNNWTGCKAWWISASGATTFTLSVDTAPAVSMTFQWEILVRH